MNSFPSRSKPLQSPHTRQQVSTNSSAWFVSSGDPTPIREMTPSGRMLRSSALSGSTSTVRQNTAPVRSFADRFCPRRTLRSRQYARNAGVDSRQNGPFTLPRPATVGRRVSALCPPNEKVNAGLQSQQPKTFVSFGTNSCFRFGVTPSAGTGTAGCSCSIPRVIGVTRIEWPAQNSHEVCS